MIDEQVSLSDEQMQQFIRDGFVVVSIDVPQAFHQSIRSQMDDLLEREPNPGNNLLPRIPDLARIYEDPAVTGALHSILGPDYQMEDHRFPHVNKRGSEPQKIHKDGARRGEHRVRRACGFYYPQDTPERHGPTGVLPGSQYFNEMPDIPVLPLSSEAGVVIIAHYEIWHLATANLEDHPRYMMKFQFTRTEEPDSPTWDFENAEWDTDSRMLRAIWKWHQGGQLAPEPASTQDRGSLLKDLSEESEARRLEAAYRLAAFYGDGAVDDLVDILHGSSKEAAQSALYGLAAIGAGSVGPLASLLKDGTQDKRLYAAFALSEMGTEAASAESSLRDALRDEDPLVRRCVAEGLGNCQGPSVSETIQALLPLFVDGEDRVRRAAAASVARLSGGLDRDAPDKMIADLKTALSNDNRYVRGLAAKALERIGTPESLQIVIDWLHVSRWCPLTTADSPF